MPSPLGVLTAGVIPLLVEGRAISPSSLHGSNPDSPLRLQLENGVTVILAEHHAADVAAVQLWVRVGACDEAHTESGLSHFIEHLLFKGTPTRGRGLIDRTIAGLGGEMNAATSQDFTYYHIVLPARHVETALDVVADATVHAAFDPEEIERERLVVIEEMRRLQDDPSAYLWRFLSRQLFAGHPYGQPVLGTPETIRRATREQIVEYHGRHYVPAGVTVVIVGNIHRMRTLAHVREMFGAWAPRPALDRQARPVPGHASVRRAEEPRPLQQAYLGVAWHGPVVPDPDVYAADLLASILGRGRSSRLYQTLKERRGLVSSIGAGYSARRDAGTVTVTARTSTAQRHDVEAALLAEIDRLRAALVSEAEIGRALTGIEAGYAFGYETAEGMARAYGLAETVWTLEFELGYLDAIRKVTREEIREAARRYLTPDRFTGVVLGPTNGTQ